MKLSEFSLRPCALGRGHLTRSFAIQVRAAARQSPTKTSEKETIPREEQIVETVEVAALTAAAAAGGLALSRSLVHTAPTQSGKAPPEKRTAAVTGTTLPPEPQPNIETLWITGPMLIAVAARSIAARLARYVVFFQNVIFTMWQDYNFDLFGIVYYLYLYSIHI